MRAGLLALVGVGLLTTACIHTQEMPLAPNVVRLDTQAAGLLFTSQAAPKTLRRAAELTLQKGYTHFRLDQAQVAQGSELAGVYSSGQSTAYGSATGSRYGNTTYINGSARASGYTMSTPMYYPTANIGVTVFMLRADDPHMQGAFDAAEVLRSKSD